MAKKIFIGGRIESAEVGGVVTGANAILDDTKQKKQNVINKETDDELERLENAKQDNLTFDNAPTENSTNPVTSGGVYTADKALSDAVEAILLLIPSAATALNQLADKAFVNSTEATNTATFRGTSATGLTEQQFLDWADSLTHDKNDYVFWQTIDAAGNTQFKRYKYDGTQWLYEYTLNNSSFTADQWAAISSGITAALVTKLTNLPNVTELGQLFDGKQNVLTFDDTPRLGSNNPVKSNGVYDAIHALAQDISANALAIQGINNKIPEEAALNNQLADKAYVVSTIAAAILEAICSFKGQFTTLAELQNVSSPKNGDLGIVRTKDSDGKDVFTFYQYLSNAWNVFYTLEYHPQTKPASTGTTGDYPYNGMGCVELEKNMVNTGTELAPVMVNQLTQDMFYKGDVGNRVPNTNTIFVIQYDYVLGEDITVPANCVLEFDGGSVNGGKIIVNNTEIKGDTSSSASIVGIAHKNGKQLMRGSWNTPVFNTGFNLSTVITPANGRNTETLIKKDLDAAIACGFTDIVPIVQCYFQNNMAYSAFSLEEYINFNDYLGIFAEKNIKAKTLKFQHFFSGTTPVTNSGFQSYSNLVKQFYNAFIEAGHPIKEIFILNEYNTIVNGNSEALDYSEISSSLTELCNYFKNIGVRIVFNFTPYGLLKIDNGVWDLADCIAVDVYSKVRFENCENTYDKIYEVVSTSIGIIHSHFKDAMIAEAGIESTANYTATPALILSYYDALFKASKNLDIVGLNNYTIYTISDNNLENDIYKLLNTYYHD